MKTTTVTIKKLEDKQRKDKEKRVKGRMSKIKIQRFLLIGDAPYVKKVEKKGR